LLHRPNPTFGVGQFTWKTLPQKNSIAYSLLIDCKHRFNQLTGWLAVQTTTHNHVHIGPNEFNIATRWSYIILSSVYAMVWRRRRFGELRVETSRLATYWTPDTLGGITRQAPHAVDVIARRWRDAVRGVQALLRLFDRCLSSRHRFINTRDGGWFIPGRKARINQHSSDWMRKRHRVRSLVCRLSDETSSIERLTWINHIESTRSVYLVAVDNCSCGLQSRSKWMTECNDTSMMREESSKWGQSYCPRIVVERSGKCKRTKNMYICAITCTCT